VVELLLDYIRKSNDHSSKVLDFHHPQTLKEMLAHCINIPEEPQTIEQILSDCKETLKYCVKTGNIQKTTTFKRSRVFRGMPCGRPNITQYKHYS